MSDLKKANRGLQEEVKSIRNTLEDINENITIIREHLIATSGDNTMPTTQDVLNAVQAEEEVQAKVLVMLKTVCAQLQDAQNSGNSAQMQTIIDRLNADSQQMADAVAASTTTTAPTGPTGPTASRP